jgi:Mg2+-importing ATPase
MNPLPYAKAATLSPLEIARELETTPKGLSKEDVLHRQALVGPNTIATDHETWVQRLVNQLRSSFVALLAVAALLSLFLGETLDGLLIILFITINTVLGFWQEQRSHHALRSLTNFLVPKTHVRREGVEQLILTHDLVPGDVVLLKAGDKFPADVRLTQAHDLLVDESILTGESAPIGKSIEALTRPPKDYIGARNIGFSGTLIASGEAEGIVTATGAAMELGVISKLVIDTEPESSFHRDIATFSRFILRMTVATIAVVFILQILINRESFQPVEFSVFSIALAVGVIPEALPLVTTLSLTHGALQLARKKVVPKRLSAIEDLGSITVLCTDKTGTLTENKLTVKAVFGEPPHVLSRALAASSFLGERVRQPNNAFDIAIWEATSAEARLRVGQFRHVAELPFDPQRKRNSVLIQDHENSWVIVRGAPEEVLPLCTLTRADQQAWAAWQKEQDAVGHRVIAIAERSFSKQPDDLALAEKQLRLVGGVAFIDPLKKSTKEAIANAERLGITVKIITGDSPSVAETVGREIRLVQSAEQVMLGRDFLALSVEEQRAAVRRVSVFARVTPQEKFHIIRVLKEVGETVGFLGEGFNDAPALKLAHVGLVVESASDVSKDAADIVLLNQNLSVIIDGVEEGRITFANTTKYITATLASNFGNFYAVALSSLFVSYLPMLPVQILLVNLLSDFPMISIATDRVAASDLQRPQGYKVREIVILATVLGVVSTVFDFAFFGAFRPAGPQVLQTMWFIGSILTELAFLFSVRTHLWFFRRPGPSRTIILLTGVAAVATIALPFTEWGQRVFQFSQPTREHLIFAFALVAAYFFSTEIVKNLYLRFGARRQVDMVTRPR